AAIKHLTLPDALPIYRGISRERVWQADALGDPRCRRSRPVDRRGHHAVDRLGQREPLECRVVLQRQDRPPVRIAEAGRPRVTVRSEEHTSELQSPYDL